MRSVLPPPEELLLHCDFVQLKEYLIQSTGLAYYADKEADLARRIHRRLTSFGVPDCGSYLETLRDPHRGPTELDALISEIAIGETYFFRHREHFDALRDVVLPELIEKNKAIRRLRIWCAGCADGAEPYSLSILLRRASALSLAGWEISILGTDINRQALAVAREGRFEEWSLRSTSEDLRRDCFHREGKQWVIAPEYKEWVSFQYHNLVDLRPSLAMGSAAFDLIICRNVMIYFGSELMQRVMGRFHDCLASGAWLLVGPCEPNMTHFKSFRAVNSPGVTLYQKSDDPPVNAGGIVSPDTHPVPTLSFSPAVLAPQDSQVHASSRPCSRAAPSLEAIRQCADRGEWKEVVCSCEELLQVDNLDAVVHFYYALALERLGRRISAERSYRRAIYLDRGAIPAHYHLALFLSARGDQRPARRSFDNALQLLESRPETEIVSDADGATVAELRKIMRTQIEALGEQA